MQGSRNDSERISTGVAGLDDVLGGGLPRRRLYVVEGEPGVGKTTLALQFLLEGVRQGEPGVYISLSETEEELHGIARSHGWSLDGITVCDLQASEESRKAEAHYTLFHPSEIELSETTRIILDVVERAQPVRVVFDSLSEMRLLARDALRYRRQILALKRFFSERGCTSLMLDSHVEGADSFFQLKTVAHGVLLLEQLPPEYGGDRRRLRVQKIRGISFRDGFHDMSIRTGGIVVHPRLVAAEHRDEPAASQVPSGVAELDAMLGGGLERGTSTMLLGPAGVGKSTLAAQYMAAAAQRGERATIYTFDEAPRMWIARGDGLGMRLSEHVRDGRIGVRQVDPADLSPGEFASLVCHAVEQDGSRVIVIDSLNGYRNAMPQERHLSLHLHELLTYLGQQGVLTLLVMAQHGFLGMGVETPLELSYLADTVILLRYFEAEGQVRQALSVIKKRGGGHERSMRELSFAAGGVEVGTQRLELRGLLGSELEYTGGRGPLLHSANPSSRG